MIIPLGNVHLSAPLILLSSLPQIVISVLDTAQHLTSVPSQLSLALRNSEPHVPATCLTRPVSEASSSSHHQFGENWLLPRNEDLLWTCLVRTVPCTRILVSFEQPAAVLLQPVLLTLNGNPMRSNQCSNRSLAHAHSLLYGLKNKTALELFENLTRKSEIF